LEFVIKIYRARMNLSGEDHFIPGRGYPVFSRFVMGLFLAVITSVFVAHFAIAGWSVWTTIAQSGHGLLVWAYVVFVLLANLGADMIFLTINAQFEFEIGPRAFRVSPMSLRQ